MWYLYLTLSATAWALHVGALKYMGDRLPAAQIVFLFYLCALLTTGIILFASRQRIDFTAIAAQPRLVLALIMAGVTIGLVDFFFVKGLALGAPISIYTPLFTTVGLTLITLIGVFYFTETMTATKLLGFACAAVGFFLMAR